MTDLPVLHPFVRLLARPLPLTPLEWGVAASLTRVFAQHTGMFDRLGDNAFKRYGIEPTDLPFAFILTPDPAGPRIEALRSLKGHDVAARIAGPFLVLLDMVRGRLDGDALFFSRDIVVEGDMEAVVALRNALDAEAVDIVVETAHAFGPASGLVTHGADLAERFARTFLVAGSDRQATPPRESTP